MKTPKLFTDNLKNKIITMSMLESVIYSINKRAKNCRDNARRYKNSRDNYGNYEKEIDKRDKYYCDKDYLLKTLLKPKCIHVEKGINEYCKVFSENDSEFHGAEPDMIIDEWTNNNGTDLKRVKVLEEYSRYYLFYPFSNTSFHSPIDDNNLEKYDLEIITIDNLNTFGKDINDLVSIQFCQKVIDLIKTNDFIFN
jgi:hypothetical protein